MYAIFVTGGKQYKVTEGDEIFIEKLDVEAGQSVKFDNVIFTSDGETTNVSPKAVIDATVVKSGRSKKIIVYKYKPKKGYHKKQGHRQAYTKVKIDKINL